MTSFPTPYKPSPARADSAFALRELVTTTVIEAPDQRGDAAANAWAPVVARPEAAWQP